MEQIPPLGIVAGNRENVPGAELFRVPVTTPQAPAGVATLVAGAATVSLASVKATSRIFLSRQAAGGTLGHLSVQKVIPGVSFGILSSSNSDTSVIAWIIQ